MASGTPDTAAATTDAPAKVATPELILAMLDSGKGISDLIFSPGRPPQVEAHGELVARRRFRPCSMLTPDDTARIAGI